jgi:hypothetical protein
MFTLSKSLIPLIAALCALANPMLPTLADGDAAHAKAGLYAPPDVYAAGHDGADAFVWLNGKVLYKLNAEGYGAKANSIYVLKRDVFAAGYEINAHGTTVAKAWKNGHVLYAIANAIANSIHVSDENVYVAGYVFAPKGKAVAMAWKNGEALYTFTNGKNWAEANSIHVSGDDAYVAGNDGTAAKVWKNGRTLYSLGKKNATANSVHISGGHVYVAGSKNNGGKVWRDGIELYSSQMEDLSCVFVYDKELHVAGSWQEQALHQPQPKKKSNAVKNPSETPTGHSWSVFALADDVYLAGYEKGDGHRKNQAIIWKNGEELFRLTNGNNDAEVRSVFAK